jgi:protein-S-isoprenylcysteine O-methyltransferase Ste14
MVATRSVVRHNTPTRPAFFVARKWQEGNTMVFYIGGAVLVVLSVYCWLGIRKAYGKGEVLPLRISAAIWVLDTVHLLLVSLASLWGVWQLQFNSTVGLVSGLVLIGVGLATLLAGMIAFRSLRRISGMDSSGLVTTGIYRWSRNPQYTGWFICLLGISLMGRSGHLYTVQLEEPYLEHVLGDKYRVYKSRTARYIGILRK